MTKEVFSTGFQNIDEYLGGGLKVGNEFVVVGSRADHMKSFVAEKIATVAWNAGYNVGYFTAELSREDLMNRCNTLETHTKLDYADNKYKDYLDHLKKQANTFSIATFREIGPEITVEKIREWVEQNNIKILILDDFSYLSREFNFLLPATLSAYRNLATTLDITVIVTMQLNRTYEYVDNPSHLLATIPTPARVLICNKVSDNDLNIIAISKAPVEKTPSKKFIYNVNIQTGVFDYVGESEVMEAV